MQHKTWILYTGSFTEEKWENRGLFKSRHEAEKHAKYFKCMAKVRHEDLDAKIESWWYGIADGKEREIFLPAARDWMDEKEE